MATHDAIRLEVEDLWKERVDGRRRIRIAVPEFSVAAGAFVAVTGANGSGKSTLLDMLGLLLSPDHAQRFVLREDGGIDLRALSPAAKRRVRRRYFAYALQNGGLLDCLSLRDNLRLAARLKNRAASGIADLARMLELDNVLDAFPGKISGGQRQKASLACALVQEPCCILADEPNAALDPPSARALLEMFHRVTRERGISLVMVTHAVELIQDCADVRYHFQVDPHPCGQIRSTLAPWPLRP